MTAVIPWGESRQVQLSHRGYVSQVYVLGRTDPVGSVHLSQWPNGKVSWMAVTTVGFTYQDSLGEAVMWVLRRTATKTWLKHRPVVYRVRSLLRYDGHLVIYDTNDKMVDQATTLEEAVKLADQHARHHFTAINN